MIKDKDEFAKLVEDTALDMLRKRELEVELRIYRAISEIFASSVKLDKEINNHGPSIMSVYITTLTSLDSMVRMASHAINTHEDKLNNAVMKNSMYPVVMDMIIDLAKFFSLDKTNEFKEVFGQYLEDKDIVKLSTVIYDKGIYQIFFPGGNSDSDENEVTRYALAFIASFYQELIHTANTMEPSIIHGSTMIKFGHVVECMLEFLCHLPNGMPLAVLLKIHIIQMLMHTEFERAPELLKIDNHVLRLFNLMLYASSEEGNDIQYLAKRTHEYDEIIDMTFFVFDDMITEMINRHNDVTFHRSVLIDYIKDTMEINGKDDIVDPQELISSEECVAAELRYIRKLYDRYSANRKMIDKGDSSSLEKLHNDFIGMLSDKIADSVKQKYEDKIERENSIHEACVRVLAQLALTSRPKPVEIVPTFSKLQTLYLSVIRKLNNMLMKVDSPDSYVIDNMTIMTVCLQKSLEMFGFDLDAEGVPMILNKGADDIIKNKFSDINKYPVPLRVHFEVLTLIHHVLPGELTIETATDVVSGTLPLIVATMSDPSISDPVKMLKDVNDKTKEVFDQFLYFEPDNVDQINPFVFNAIFRYKYVIDKRDIGSIPTPDDLIERIEDYNESIEFYLYVVDEIIRRSDNEGIKSTPPMNYIFKLFGIQFGSITDTCNMDIFDDAMNRLRDALYKGFKESKGSTVISTSEVKEKKPVDKVKLRDILTKRDKEPGDMSTGTEYIHITVHKDEE